MGKHWKLVPKEEMFEKWWKLKWCKRFNFELLQLFDVSQNVGKRVWWLLDAEMSIYSVQEYHDTTIPYPKGDVLDPSRANEHASIDAWTKEAAVFSLPLGLGPEWT